MQPLASSRGTSNGPDWKDVHQTLLNYELLYGTKIHLCLHSAGLDGVEYLVLEAKTEPYLSTNGEVSRSVCVNATMRSLNVKTLSAAFMNLLFRLDRAVEQAHYGPGIK